MGTVLVISKVFPSKTSMMISVVLLLVLSLTSFKELNLMSISLEVLG